MKPRESWSTTPLSRGPGAHVTNEKSAELATNKLPTYMARKLVEKDILYSVRSTFPMPAILTVVWPGMAREKEASAGRFWPHRAKRVEMASESAKPRACGPGAMQRLSLMIKALYVLQSRIESKEKNPELLSLSLFLFHHFPLFFPLVPFGSLLLGFPH